MMINKELKINTFFSALILYAVCVYYDADDVIVYNPHPGL